MATNARISFQATYTYLAQLQIKGSVFVNTTLPPNLFISQYSDDNSYWGNTLNALLPNKTLFSVFDAFNNGYVLLYDSDLGPITVNPTTNICEIPVTVVTETTNPPTQNASATVNCSPPPTVAELSDTLISGPPSNGQVLTYESGLWINQNAGGGPTVPGGANTDVQYNSSGSFAGDSGLTYDGAGNLTASVSVSADTAVYTANVDAVATNLGVGVSTSGTLTVGNVSNAGVSIATGGTFSVSSAEGNSFSTASGQTQVFVQNGDNLLTLSDGDILTSTAPPYVPANPQSVATKSYVDTSLSNVWINGVNAGNLEADNSAVNGATIIINSNTETEINSSTGNVQVFSPAGGIAIAANSSAPIAHAGIITILASDGVEVTGSSVVLNGDSSANHLLLNSDGTIYLTSTNNNISIETTTPTGEIVLLAPSGSVVLSGVNTSLTCSGTTTFNTSAPALTQNFIQNAVNMLQISDSNLLAGSAYSPTPASQSLATTNYVDSADANFIVNGVNSRSVAVNNSATSGATITLTSNADIQLIATGGACQLFSDSGSEYATTAVGMSQQFLQNGNLLFEITDTNLQAGTDFAPVANSNSLSTTSYVNTAITPMITTGTATLSSGTVAVTCANVLNTSAFALTYNTLPPAATNLTVTAITPGVAFQVTSTNPSDAGVFYWCVMNNGTA